MKKIFFISALLLAYIFTGCKFLEEEDYNQVETNVIFSDKNKVILALDGCYDNLQFQLQHFISCLEVPTDYVINTHGRNVNSVMSSWQSGIITYSDQWPTAVWSNLYSTIYSCNYFLDNVGQATLPDSVRNCYKGQARFIRGYCYLMLTNLFKDVPLRLSSKYTQGQYHCPISLQSDVYEVILEDLKYAEDHLFDFDYSSTATYPFKLDRTLDRPTNGYYTASERQRVDVDAAIGMQALTYLYRAGNDPASPDWIEAKNKADTLINHRRGGLSNALTYLNPSYGALFHNPAKNGKYHQEVLFGIYFNSLMAGEGNNIASTWGYNKYYNSSSQGVRRMTSDWYNKCFALASGGDNLLPDMRNKDMILHDMYNADGELKNTWPDDYETDMGRPRPTGTNKVGVNGGDYGAWLHKYDQIGATIENNLDPGLHQLRYAEILLIYAEAQNELGNTTEALAALNKVRARAQVTDIGPASQTELREKILLERERELFGECKRLFDMNRREMYATAMNATEAYAPNETDYWFRNNNGSTNRRYNRIRHVDRFYFSIPKIEVDTNNSINLH